MSKQQYGKRSIRQAFGRVTGPRTKRMRVVPIPKRRLKFRQPAGELKYVDLATATYALNTTGSVTLIPVIPEGTDQTERIGRRVHLKSVQFRGYAVSNATTLVTYGRMLVVWDRQPNKALAALTDILLSASSFAYSNLDNSDRFVTLVNKSIVLAGNGTTAGQQTERSMVDCSFYRRLDHTMKFSGVDGTIGDINSGALLLVTVGSTVAGTADGDLTGSFRVRFLDP